MTRKRNRAYTHFPSKEELKPLVIEMNKTRGIERIVWELRRGGTWVTRDMVAPIVRAHGVIRGTNRKVTRKMGNKVRQSERVPLQNEGRVELWWLQKRD